MFLRGNRGNAVSHSLRQSKTRGTTSSHICRFAFVNDLQQLLVSKNLGLESYQVMAGAGKKSIALTEEPLNNVAVH